MDITQSARSVDLQHRLQDFMAAHLYPVERELYLAAERLGPWAIYPHIEDLKARARAATIDRTPRGWERPSDHAPAVLELADA